MFIYLCIYICVCLFQGIREITGLWRSVGQILGGEKELRKVTVTLWAMFSLAISSSSWVDVSRFLRLKIKVLFRDFMLRLWMKEGLLSRNKSESESVLPSLKGIRVSHHIFLISDWIKVWRITNAPSLTACRKWKY